MAQDFIDKIRALIMSNISDEKFGVKDLASQLGLSASQTLRKVKDAKGKSINQYIRELRLEKAAKLIKNTDHTIAEISYQVGFGSPSYFNKAFVRYYGIAPGEYKIKSISLSELAATKTKKSPPKISLKKIVYSLIIVLVFVIGYFLITNSTSKKTSFSKSIAVLPFKDYSPENSRWFSDGITDNIISSLAQIQGLSVTSFTSSSTYRDTDKQIPKIAKELGVSYILEGSVTKFDDKVKIIAQLIDSNDNHVWSKVYDESFENVIAIQKNVAWEVMDQMEMTLSPKEKVIFDTYPTKNMEAYSLYLKGGQTIRASLSEVALWKVIELNKQAIALDSSFAEAYATVGHAYFLLSHHHSITVDPFESREQAAYYANKALQIDPKSSNALRVKGNLFLYVDWDKAREYYQKAISINPNYVNARSALAIYFLQKPNPDYKKALENYRIAFQSAPLYDIYAINLLSALIMNNKLKEAEEHYKKTAYLYHPAIKIYYKYMIIALQNKDWTTVIPLLKTEIKEEPNNGWLYYSLGILYDDLLNDDTTAKTYFKKAVEIDSLNPIFLSDYISRLVESKRYTEGKKEMESENYRSITSKRSQLNQLWHFYYHKGEYQKAQDVLKDSLFRNQYIENTITYAQLGERKKVDSMNKRYPWGTGYYPEFYPIKARIYGILEDRDSMYYSLENIRNIRQIIIAIRQSEFDPYKKEERYKAFLKKWYLPVSSE